MSAHGEVLEFRGLGKVFGAVRAVHDLSFTVSPGVVTGFLGPNGAGKTTTMRCLLGLVQPTAGTATIGGRSYRDLAQPLREVGAALESSDFHPGRSALDHLEWLALAAGIPRPRCREVLAMVAMQEHAHQRVGGFSLGMRQRLALAQALLGDPPVLVLDEPANGLDPAGIAWLRGLLRSFAAEGRTVLVSSHVLSEVQQTVDDVVVISRGRLVRQSPLAELDAGPRNALVVSPDPDALRSALESTAGPGAVEPLPEGGFRVHGCSAALVGRAAHLAGVELHELRDEPGDLERLFLELTRDEEAR
jgi:ABC-2 type transport system ATP-binding protein